MNIIEATNTAVVAGSGITNPDLKQNGFYLLPTNTDECYFIINIGCAITHNLACPRWNPKIDDILREDWELHQ